jgi:hypothetical protein
VTHASSVLRTPHPPLRATLSRKGARAVVSNLLSPRPFGERSDFWSPMESIGLQGSQGQGVRGLLNQCVTFSGNARISGF